MVKYSINDLTGEELAKCMSALGAGNVGGGGALPPSAHAQTPPPPPQTASPGAPMTAQAGAPPPPPSAGAGAPPPAPASAAPPPPPPPQPQAQANPKAAAVLAAMQLYSKTHKAAGVKAVLGICKLDKVTDANDAQLDWLKQAFDSNATPAQLGAV